MKKVLFILGELDDADIDWMIHNSQRDIVTAGTVLIHEGQPIDALYILLDGELSVSTTAVADREIAVLSSGEIVGEMSFIDTRPPSATVKAKQPCSILAIPRPQLISKLEEDIGFAARFYRALAVFLSNRLRITVNQLGFGTEAHIPTTEGLMDGHSAAAMEQAQARLDWLLQRLRGN